MKIESYIHSYAITYSTLFFIYTNTNGTMNKCLRYSHFKVSGFKVLYLWQLSLQAVDFPLQFNHSASSSISLNNSTAVGHNAMTTPTSSPAHTWLSAAGPS